MSVIKFSLITVPTARFGSKKERGKEAGKGQVARQAPQCLCELHFSIGFPEEQLKFPILTIKHLLILDEIVSLQFLLMLAKMKYQLEHRTKSGLICKKDKPLWRYKLLGLYRHFALRSGSFTSPQPAGNNHHRRAPQQPQFKHTPQTHLQWIFPSTEDDLAQLQEEGGHLYHTHVLTCSCWLGSLLSPQAQPNESTISTWVSLLPLVLGQSPCRDKNPVSPSPAHSSIPAVLWHRPVVVCSRKGK